MLWWHHVLFVWKPTCMHPCVGAEVSCSDCVHQCIHTHPTFHGVTNCDPQCIPWHIDTSFLHICAKTQQTAIYTSHVIAKYVLETYMPTRFSIYVKYFDTFMEDVYTNMWHIWSHLNQPCDNGTVHIFDIYHWINMVVTLHMYVPLHCYCSAFIDPILVHTYLKHLISATVIK